MLLLTVFDYIAPSWLAKVGGGSKRSVWGATIGMLLGLFFMPWGLVLGPFLGAFLGELSSGFSFRQALRVGFLSFVGFLLTTGLKLVYGLILLLYVTYLAVKWMMG